MNHHPDPYQSPNVLKKKELNCTNMMFLSPKDEAEQALKVEIKSHIEKRIIESNLKVT